MGCGKMMQADKNAMGILKKKMNELMTGKGPKKGESVEVKIAADKGPEMELEDESGDMVEMAEEGGKLDEAKALVATLSDEEKKKLLAELMA